MEEARHCIARRNLSCSAPGRYPDQGQSYGIAEQADNCRSIEPIRSKHRLLEHPHLTENACQHEGGENCHPISSRPCPLVPMPASHRFHMRLPSDGYPVRARRGPSAFRCCSSFRCRSSSRSNPFNTGKRNANKRSFVFEPNDASFRRFGDESLAADHPDCLDKPVKFTGGGQANDEKLSRRMSRGT